MNAVIQPELVCPAGSPRALDVALEAGADAVYLGLRDATNARNFAGLNFSPVELRAAVRRAHASGRKVLMALNTQALSPEPGPWLRAVDVAADAGVDALIAADVAVMAHAKRHHPALRLHLSVQGSATNHEAIALYHERYGIQRAVTIDGSWTGAVSSGTFVFATSGSKCTVTYAPATSTAGATTTLGGC